MNKQRFQAPILQAISSQIVATDPPHDSKEARIFIEGVEVATTKPKPKPIPVRSGMNRHERRATAALNRGRK